MKVILYREIGTELIDEISEIYQRASWGTYLGDKEKLVRTFENSLYILGAFHENQLVGFVRCVGDGEHIVYVQDLIVDVEYKRQGIGKNLLTKAMEKFSNVRMFTLITDAMDDTSNLFYKAIGLKQYNNNGLVGYFR